MTARVMRLAGRGGAPVATAVEGGYDPRAPPLLP